MSSGTEGGLLGRELLRGTVCRLLSRAHHPNMQGMSAHMRLRDHARLGALEPISSETLRFVFAFAA